MDPVAPEQWVSIPNPVRAWPILALGSSPIANSARPPTSPTFPDGSSKEWTSAADLWRVFKEMYLGEPIASQRGHVVAECDGGPGEVPEEFPPHYWGPGTEPPDCKGCSPPEVSYGWPPYDPISLGEYLDVFLLVENQEDSGGDGCTEGILGSGGGLVA